jgi:hypothetical protein
MAPLGAKHEPFFEYFPTTLDFENMCADDIIGSKSAVE